MGERSNDTLTANRAFVVQFCPADSEGETCFEGHIDWLLVVLNILSSQQDLWKLRKKLLTGKLNKEAQGE